LKKKKKTNKRVKEKKKKETPRNNLKIKSHRSLEDRKTMNVPKDEVCLSD